MNTPDIIYDLKGLSGYCSLKIPTLRDYIKSGGLPCFKVKGKILVKRSEFDNWLEGYRINKKQDLYTIVDGVMESLKS
jgi:hypothetical protein